MAKVLKGQSVSANPHSVSSKEKEEAMKIALGIQKPGQVKEQTRLVAQGIQKGIELYKKQQNAKNREIDKKRKQALKQQVKESAPTLEASQTGRSSYIWLPWTLFFLTWLGIGVYFTFY